MKLYRRLQMQRVGLFGELERRAGALYGVCSRRSDTGVDRRLQRQKPPDLSSWIRRDFPAGAPAHRRSPNEHGGGELIAQQKRSRGSDGASILQCAAAPDRG